MTVRHTPGRPLTALQQAIVDFVWSRGPSTAEEVRQALVPEHRLKDASVRTLLRRLESRGYLTHSVDGKVFRYEAVVGTQTVAANAVRNLIDRFWSGSIEKFLVGLVDEDVLSPAELERLARKVKAQRKAR
jgi:predicted transcriptional regulator